VAEGGYPRDLRGYGRNPPDPRWPGNARVAVQFVVNFEEGGENNILHGDSLKWIEHKDMSEAEERAEIADAIRIHTEVTGERPLGWYTGRSSINTVRLVMEAGGFLYSCDSYADDLPYWIKGPAGPHLIIPYTLDANDMRFVNAQGFGGGEEFFTYLKDSFDVLYAEGETSPKMMSVGLHCRLVGRPGRAAALIRFLDYIMKHERVWVPTRLEIAQHWHVNLKHLAEQAHSIG
jgi:peptidoglycan/xylan/chitin deacetylase (PgdA/CDA1 family)